MPELDPVTQDFTADVAPYIEALRLAADEARAFAEANATAIEAIKLLEAQMNDLIDWAALTKTALAQLGETTEGLMGPAVGAAHEEEQLADNIGGVSSAAVRSMMILKTMGTTLDELRDAAGETVIALGTLNEKMDTVVANTAEIIAALDRVEAQMRGLAETAAVTGQAIKAAMDSQTQEIAENAAVEKASLDSIGDSMTKLTGNMVANAAVQRGVLGTIRQNWGITANFIHWAISGTAEFLAVSIPAAIALASAAFVAYQGMVEEAGYRMYAMYETGESTASMIHKTAGQVLGLGDAFQKAQNQMNPQAYELLGEYIEGAKLHMSDLAQAGEQVYWALDRLGAEMDVDLVRQGSQFSALISKMASDAIHFGEVLGNLGHAILNLAGDMPGLAEKLLDVAVAISKVIEWISSLPHYLVLSFFAFEEFIRWGGLLLGLFSKLVMGLASLAGALGAEGLAANLETAANKMSTLATAASHFGAVLKAVALGAINAIKGLVMWVVDMGAYFLAVSAEEGILIGVTSTLQAVFISLRTTIESFLATIGPVGWTILLIGALVGVIAAFGRTGTAAQNMGNKIEDAVNKASNVNALNTIAEGLTTVNKAMTAAGKTGQQYGMDVHTGMTTGAYAVHGMGAAWDQLNAIQNRLQTQFGNVLKGGEAISKEFGTNFTTSLALADVAGVKLANTTVGFGKALTTAGAEIAGLVDGYKAADQVGGIFGNDMNVLDAQLAEQDSRVAQLNEAWDDFLSDATGLTSNFTSLKTEIGEINNAITTSGTKFDTFSGKAVTDTQKAAMAMRSFSGVGAQVWQNYDSALSQAEQYTDSLRTAATYGGISQQAFRQQIAYTVQQLLPYAQYSKTATSQLSILAQEADGPATSSYSKLKAWVDRTTESTKQFDKQTQDETADMSNASKVAQEFASTLNDDVQAELAKAALASDHFDSQINNLFHDIKSGSDQAAVDLGTKMVTELKATGVSGSVATAEIKDGMIAAGIPMPEVDRLIQQINNDLGDTPGKAQSASQAAQTMAHDIKTGADAAANAVGTTLYNSFMKSSNGADQAKSRMISDLHQAGMSVTEATKLVDGFARVWNNLHSKEITLTENEDVYQSLFTKGGTAPGKGVLKQFGGMIPGMQFGGSPDTIMAMLAPGEAVLSADTVRALGGARGVNAANASPGWALRGTGSGATGTITLHLNLSSYLDGTQVANSQRTQTLIYNRHNSSNNLSLRAR